MSEHTATTGLDAKQVASWLHETTDLGLLLFGEVDDGDGVGIFVWDVGEARVRRDCGVGGASGR